VDFFELYNFMEGDKPSNIWKDLMINWDIILPTDSIAKEFRLDTGIIFGEARIIIPFVLIKFRVNDDSDVQLLGAYPYCEFEGDKPQFVETEDLSGYYKKDPILFRKLIERAVMLIKSNHNRFDLLPDRVKNRLLKIAWGVGGKYVEDWDSTF